MDLIHHDSFLTGTPDQIRAGRGVVRDTAKIISGKSGIRIVFRKAFLPLQALKSYLQPPVFPGESQSVNQVLA